MALLLLLLPAVLQGCGDPSQGGDCDRLLGEEKYERVLQVCGSPFHRSSARLGLAGFNMLDLVESTEPPGSVVTLLELTPGNVTEKRLHVAGAAEEVREPVNGNEAFALLVSAYLGLAVTMEEYLDNGATGPGPFTNASCPASAVPLDDFIFDCEVEGATGLTPRLGATLQIQQSVPPNFQVVATEGSVAGRTFSVVCTDVANSGDAAHCDDAPPGSAQVFDDPDGSGRLATPQSADRDEVVLDLHLADPVNMVVQMNGLELPFALDPARAPRMDNFLGEGDPAGEFTIGVAGYLGLLTTAEQTLTSSSGTEGGGSQTVTDNVNAVRDLLDNGAPCIAQNDPAGAALINLLYAVYASAPGTAANPAAGLSDFTPNNIATNAEVQEAEDGGVVFPVTVNAADFVFVQPIGFKLLYPIALPATGFDVGNATPRMDEADPDFRGEFENVPRLAPEASPAGDGRVTFAELSCARK
jgi:hypothetical protein